MLRFLLGVLLGLFVGGPLAAAPLSPRVMFELPTLDAPMVSPSGKQMVILNVLNGQQHLSVLDLASLKTTPIGRLGTAHVLSVVWKGEDWLYLALDDGRGVHEFRSVDLRAAKVTPIFRVNWGQLTVDPLPDSPDEVLLAEFPGTNTLLTRFNVRTDKSRTLEKVSGYVPIWIVNERAEPVAAQGFDGEKSWVLWREPGETTWRRRDLKTGVPYELYLHSLHADGKRVLAVDRSPAGPARIVAFDPRNGESTEVFRSPDVDPGAWIFDLSTGARALGVRYETDRVRTHFFTPEAGKLQQLIDQALPDTANFILSTSADQQTISLIAVSERSPGSYYLLDRRAGKLMPLGPRCATVNPAEMGIGRPIEFTARDGLHLRGRLLLPPKSATPPPLVVISEKYGQGDRAGSDFDWLGQLFASRGYAVARFDVRGTWGYGRDFVAKGAYQVAKQIPQDLEDGVRWVLTQNLVDPKRVIMAGFNTGGWPAMHALAGSSLFAGWINWNTPMQTEGFTTADFALATRTRDQATNELGGGTAGVKFLESINPADLLPRIAVPSFHYYFQSPDLSLANFGDQVERHYRRSSVPHVLAVRRHADTRQQDIDASVEVYEKLFAFLAQRFPPEARP